MEQSNLKNVEKPEDLNNEDLARLVVDMFHRIMVHYTLWYTSVKHQFGIPRSLEVMREAKKNAYNVLMDRFAKVLGFKMIDGIPEPLLKLPREKLIDLMNNLGVNWLANDGIWFQAVESKRNMFDAKRCNDTCWTRFSPFEAWSIKEFLGMPEQAGLEGLKTALRFRMYSRINVQSIIDESPNSIIFQMNDCRVQSARKRRGLEDYPCKSAGLVEYHAFGETIDDRIVCECLGCPPDEHPEDWYCAWRFTLYE